jgi:hypothetical protein
MNPERRSLPRQEIHSLVYLDLQPNNGGILLNLSEKGMRITVACPLTTTGPVHFSFGLDARSRIEGVGRIAWLSESGKSAGVRFLEFPESSLGQISRWLKGITATAGVEEITVEEIHDRTEPPATLEAATNGHESDTSRGVTAWIPPDPIVEFSPKPLSFSDVARHAAVQTASEAAVAEETPPPPLPQVEEDTQTESGLPESPGEENAPGLVYCLYGIGEKTARLQESTDREIDIAEESPPLPLESASSPAEALLQQLVVPQPAVVEEREALVYVKPGLPAPPVRPNDRLPVFTMPDYSRSPISSHQLATSVFCDELREIGWGMERDWHVRLGLVLEAAGFVVLWQGPSLTLLAITFWITGTVLLLDRKRPPAGWKQEHRAERR